MMIAPEQTTPKFDWNSKEPITKEEFEALLQKALLGLTEEKNKFFYYTLCNVTTKASELPMSIEGCVGTKNGQIKILVNERMAAFYEVAHMLDILLHESQHPTRLHQQRRGNRLPIHWNISGDHVIDSSLKTLGISRPLIKWNIIPELEGKNMSEEEVYEWLIENSIVIDEGNLPQPPEGEFDKEKGEGKGKKVIIISQDGKSYNYNGEFDGSLDVPETQTEEEKQAEGEFVNKVRAFYQHEKERGKLPSNIIDMFDKFMKVKIPWEQLLEKAIRNSIFEKTERRSYTRPNKIYQVAIGMTLPGRVNQNDDSIGRLIIHIDTSGSMSQQELMKGADVICQSIGKFHETLLIVGDMKQSQKEVEFHKGDETAFINYMKTVGFNGGGGTSHRWMFDFCEEKFDDDLSMVISFTDLCSDVEELLKDNNYSFVNSVPVCFICNTDRTVDEGKIFTIRVN